MNANKTILYLSCVVLSIFLIAANPGGASNSQNHCYALISPVNTNSDEFSKILETNCFDSFYESLKAATNGRILIDSSIQPHEVTDDLLSSFSGDSLTDQQVVIGIDWDYADFGGGSYTWVVATSGCSSSVSYNVPTMPSGWDNRVSSARGYSNCNSFYHYQNTDFGGSSVVCNITGCSTMGSLDNATSSEKWLYTP